MACTPHSIHIRRLNSLPNYIDELRHSVSANKSKGQTVATSRRSERRAQRQKDYISSVQAAVRFRLARFFKRWRQPNQQSPCLLPPPSMSSP